MLEGSLRRLALLLGSRRRLGVLSRAARVGCAEAVDQQVVGQEIGVRSSDGTLVVARNIFARSDGGSERPVEFFDVVERATYDRCAVPL